MFCNASRPASQRSLVERDSARLRRVQKTASQMMQQREQRTVCLFVIPSLEREKLGDANHVIDHDADR
jgi:hypothetical protein